jgi:Protein of unknown function (DUF2752)
MTTMQSRRPAVPFGGVTARLWLYLPVAAFGLFTMLSPSDDGVTLCPFALMTGTACPGCGLTRAFAWLLRGDLARSFRYHPMALPVLLVAIGAGVWYAGRRWQRWKPPSPFLANSILIALGALLMVMWVVRLLSGDLPPV